MKELYSTDNPTLRFLPEGVQLLSGGDFDDPKVGWVNIREGSDKTIGSLNILSLKTRQNESYQMPGMPGFFVQTETPRVWVTGLTDSLYVVDLRQSQPLILKTRFSVASRPNHMINDGVMTSVGLLFGTKGLPWPEPTGELYLLPSGNPEKLLTIKTGIACSNGIAELGVDGDWLYVAYIDSPKKTVVELAINFKTGECDEIREIANFQNGSALPDGMRLAPGGEAICVAFFNPENAESGVIREIRILDGVVTREWQLEGAARVTCLTFVPGAPLGGGDASVLLVATTADEDTPMEQWAKQTGRGSMFIGETEYRLDELARPNLAQLSAFDY